MLAAHTRCCLLMARPTPMQVLLSTSVPAPTASSAPPALPTPCAMALFIPLFAVLSACAESVAHVAVLANQRSVFNSNSHTEHVGIWSCNSLSRRALVDALGGRAERKPPIRADDLCLETRKSYRNRTCAIM